MRELFFFLKNSELSDFCNNFYKFTSNHMTLGLKDECVAGYQVFLVRILCCKFDHACKIRGTTKMFPFGFFDTVQMLLPLFCFLYGFRTCRSAGRMCLFDTVHFEFSIEIFKNFCNVPCLTLHPPQAVVCRPRQTREDVRILVATIQ